MICGCGKESESETTLEQPQSVTAKSTTPAAPKPGSSTMPIPFDIAIQAALNGHAATVKQALETGTDPNQQDENGRNMLMVGAFNGHTQIAEDLLKAGTTIDTQDASGRTALMFASTGTVAETVKLLLEHKAKVNLVDTEEHWTALMFAAAEGNREIVQLLLDNEADLTLTDVDGSTAESFARDNGHVELADYLKNLQK